MKTERGAELSSRTDGRGGAVGPVTPRTRWRPTGGVLLKLAVLAAVVAAGVWAYRSNFASGPAMRMSTRVSWGTAAFPVTVAVAERGPIAGTVVYTGTVAAFNEEDIYPRVTGRIVELPVYPGDAVRQGQVVARLDDVELGSRAQEAASAAVAAEASVAQMDAEVLAAKHGIVQMERELAMATAEVTAAEQGIAQMERELAVAEAEAGYQELLVVREERLFTSGAVSRQDVENARAMVAAARAKVQAARAKLEQSRAMRAAAQAKTDAAHARVEQARAAEASALRKRDAMTAMAGQSRAALRTAEVVRGYVNILAPSNGYVVKRLVAPGVLVQPGMAILKLAQVDRVRLQANVGEKDLGSIRVGSPVTATPVGANQPPVTARVTSVFPFVDQGPRTAVVEAIIENGTRRFLPGQYILMQFSTGDRRDAVTVPPSAVARMGGQSTVWVVKDDRVEPRTVTTGLEAPDRVEITQGLAAGERVVARGREGLYAGARVADVAATKPAPTGQADRKSMPGSRGEASPKAPSGEMPDMPGMRR